MGNAGDISGLNLVPGLYKWGGAVTIPGGLTLAGGANDVWIFQIAGALTTSANVTLTGGAQAKNVFWQVAGGVTLGAGSHFEGVILGQTAITLQAGATMNGRALAQSAVTLDTDTVAKPAPWGCEKYSDNRATALRMDSLLSAELVRLLERVRRPAIWMRIVGRFDCFAGGEFPVKDFISHSHLAPAA